MKTSTGKEKYLKKVNCFTEEGEMLSYNIKEGACIVQVSKNSHNMERT